MHGSHLVSIEVSESRFKGVYSPGHPETRNRETLGTSLLACARHPESQFKK